MAWCRNVKHEYGGQGCSIKRESDVQRRFVAFSLYD